MNARLAPKWQRVSAWGGGLVLCCLLLATGCQSVDPSVELLESELRWLEDQLYLLDDQLEQKSAELESCRRYNQSLEAEQFRGTSSSGSDTARPRGIGSILRSRTDDSGDGGYGDDNGNDAGGEDGGGDDDGFDLTPPQIDDGVEGLPNIDVSFPDDGAAVPPRLETGDQSAWPTDQYEDSSMSASLNGTQLRVSQIVLNSRLTGGYDFDGQPGDEGLLVVIEPRDAAGKYVPLPAPVSVEVFDTSGRIARWDFDISEATTKMRTTLLGRGIHLELPWPIQPPNNTQLRVVAKYDDVATRRELIAKRTVRVDLMPNAQRMLVGPAPVQLPPDRGVADSFSTEPIEGLPVSLSPGSLSPGSGVNGWTKRKNRGGFSASKERGDKPAWSPMR